MGLVVLSRKVTLNTKLLFSHNNVFNDLRTFNNAESSRQVYGGYFLSANIYLWMVLESKIKTLVAQCITNLLSPPKNFMFRIQLSSLGQSLTYCLQLCCKDLYKNCKIINCEAINPLVNLENEESDPEFDSFYNDIVSGCSLNW